MTVARRKRVKLGDVFEVDVRGRFAHLQYLGKHPIYGDVIFVSSDLKVGPAPVSAERFEKGYVAFYPVRASVAAGLVEVKGALPPAAEVPQRLRRAGARSGKRVDTWIIEN